MRKIFKALAVASLAVSLLLQGCINHEACTASIVIAGQTDREASLKRINDELRLMKFRLQKPPLGAEKWLVYTRDVFESAPEFTLGILAVEEKNPSLITVSIGVSADRFSKEGIALYRDITARLGALFGAANVTPVTANSCGQAL